MQASEYRSAGIKTRRPPLVGVRPSNKGKILGGPYKTLQGAKKRLRQLEFFKHQSLSTMGGKYLRFADLGQPERIAHAHQKHVFVGTGDSRDSGQSNQTLTNHAKVGLLGSVRSNRRTATERRFCCIQHDPRAQFQRIKQVHTSDSFHTTLHF